jgi:hypothetical protein
MADENNHGARQCEASFSIFSASCVTTESPTMDLAGDDGGSCLFFPAVKKRSAATTLSWCTGTLHDTSM